MRGCFRVVCVKIRRVRSIVTDLLVEIVGAHPGVSQSLHGCQPHLSVRLEQLLDEVMGVRRDVLPHCSFKIVVGRLDLLEDLIGGLTVKGHFAREENERDDTNGPHIAAFVIAVIDHLGSHVIGRAGDHSEVVATGVRDSRHSEVY